MARFRSDCGLRLRRFLAGYPNVALSHRLQARSHSERNRHHRLDGGRVRIEGERPASLALVIAALALSACNPQEYAGEPGVYSVAIDENTTPYLVTEDGGFFFIERRVEFDVEAPSQGKLGQLFGTPAPPFPRSPWIGWGDLPFEIDWSLTNLADASADVTVTVNGINEFFEYMPAFTVDDGDVVADYCQWERRYVLEPFETREGTIHESETDEIAVDLATVVNGAPNANQIVYFENQHDHDPRAEPYIPEVVPGLVGVRIGLEAVGTRRVILEATLRMRDVEGRLVDPDERWQLPVPTVFTPVPPADEGQ